MKNLLSKPMVLVLLGLFNQGLCGNTVSDFDRYDIDFDESMGKGGMLYNQCINSVGRYKKTTAPRPTTDLLDLFRELYEQNNLANVKIEAEAKIPKVIHHVWLGGPFPEAFKKLRQTWVNMHPDWVFVFWADNPVNFQEGVVVLEDEAMLREYLLESEHPEQMLVMNMRGVQLDNQHFYNEATNYGEKSDILKWEIVYRYGGVYIDTDFECLKPLDVFHHAYDFYVGIQPLDVSHLVLGAALFGAVPGDEILKCCIESLQDNRQYRAPWLRTGPVPFTKAFFKTIEQGYSGKAIALPSSYFYPVGIRQKRVSRLAMEKLFKPESFAIHHWAGSW